MQAMESQFDVCTEDLFNQTILLELAREPTLLLRRGLSLRTKYHLMKRRLTIS